MASSDERPASETNGAKEVEEPAAVPSSGSPDRVQADLLPSELVHDEQPAASVADSDDDEEDDRRKRVPAGEDEPQREQPTRSNGTAPTQSATGSASQRPPDRPTSSMGPASRQARYFIMKSINHENIQISVAEGIWATQSHNEAKLNEAFRTVANVFLIFSVNSSGLFQGYARMTSPAMKQARGKNFPGFEGNTFCVQWQRVFDLPFEATGHLRNPLNENKPVKISRDGQELPADVGDQMVALIVKAADAAGVKPPPPPQRNGMRGGPTPPLGRSAPMRPQGPRPPIPIADPQAMVFDAMGRPIGNVNSLMRAGPMMGPGFGAPGMHGGRGMGPMMGPGNGFGMMGGRGPGMGGPPGGRGRGMPGGFGFEGGPMSGAPHRPRSPVPRKPQYSTRSRSRSPSPRGRRRRSRSRSASRERERERGRGEGRGGEGPPNLLNMSYDEYLEYFERMRRQRAAGPSGPSPPAGPAPPQQGNAAGGMPGNGMMGGAQLMGMPGLGPMAGMGLGMGMGFGMGMAPMGGMMAGMNPGMLGMGGMMGGMAAGGMGMLGGGMNPGMLMSEAEYIQTCEQHAAKTGMQVNRQQIKAHYQNIVAQMMGR